MGGGLGGSWRWTGFHLPLTVGGEEGALALDTLFDWTEIGKLTLVSTFWKGVASVHVTPQKDYTLRHRRLHPESLVPSSFSSPSFPDGQWTNQMY